MLMISNTILCSLFRSVCTSVMMLKLSTRQIRLSSMKSTIPRVNLQAIKRQSPPVLKIHFPLSSENLILRSEMEFRHRYEEPLPSSLSGRRKTRSTICSSCCFRGLESVEGRPSVRAWIRSKASDFPEIKSRCKGLLASIGKPSRRNCGEFRYDPLSYALNFDQGGEDDAVSWEEFRSRNFSSRLPASPPQPAVGIVCR
ncbi:hypothetical protein AXF42_Ash009338 [Apostasia shenzhenica]|uniref:Uncharacterized protein n=1 Tax=Apostasia shenzhenica TaxID=1088818 RepID=A0A2I0B3S9_9ASPA|nr:hypothetical protein AXF42_Ash009338 [Apostasia shenzhenica]